MSRAAAWVLRAAAMWSLWVWAVLIRNMLIDTTHSLGFRIVHLVLAAISILFAVALLVIAQGPRSSDGPRHPGGPGPARPPG